MVVGLSLRPQGWGLITTVVDVSGFIAAIAAAFAVPMVGYLAKLAIAAFEARTDVTLTENMRQTVIDSARTAAGEIVVQLAKGHIALADVAGGSPVVASAAKRAISAVPDAADALAIEGPDMARLVTGQVGQMLAADPATPIVTSAPSAQQSREEPGSSVGFMDAPLPRIVPRP